MVGIVAAIVVGIMALVKAFKNLYENSEPFRKTVDGLIASIKDYLLQCLDNLKTILTSLWEVLVVVWQQVIVPLFDLLVSIVEPILEAIVEVIAVLWEDVLKPLGEGIMAIVMPAFKIIVDVIKSLMPVIKAVIDILQWLWDQILEPIVKFLLDVVVNTIKIIASIVGIVIDAIVAYWENLIKIIGVGWGILKTGFLAIYNYIKDKVINPLLKLWDKLKTGWNKMWDGIKSGAKSAINWILGKVESFINGIIKGINLLSSGFRKIGNKIFDIIGVDIKFEPLSTVSLPRLETGTNEIPYEGIYHLHPGEAVVPKKYNPALGNGGNDETNQKLDTLIGIMNNMNFTNVVNIGNKTLYKEQQRYNKMQNDKYGTTVNL
jgi:phage-related protein